MFYVRASHDFNQRDIVICIPHPANALKVYDALVGTGVFVQVELEDKHHNVCLATYTPEARAAFAYLYGV